MEIPEDTPQGLKTAPFKPVFKAKVTHDKSDSNQEKREDKKTKKTKEKREIPSFSSSLVDSFKPMRKVEDIGLVPPKSSVFTLTDSDNDKETNIKKVGLI